MLCGYIRIIFDTSLTLMVRIAVPTVPLRPQVTTKQGVQPTCRPTSISSEVLTREVSVLASSNHAS